MAYLCSSDAPVTAFTRPTAKQVQDALVTTTAVTRPSSGVLWPRDTWPTSVSIIWSTLQTDVTVVNGQNYVIARPLITNNRVLEIKKGGIVAVI